MDDINLDAALRLAAAGIAVFPCQQDKRPRPGIRWKEEATTDASRIKAWWRRWPGSLPGYEPGKHRLITIDADRHGGPDGVAAIHELAQSNSDDPREWPTVETPSTGRHIFFLNPDGLTNRRGALPPGVDVRGLGGYVVGEGATLADDRSYHVPDGHFGLLDAIAADRVPTLPDWLASLLTAEKKEARQQSVGQSHQLPDTPVDASARERAAFDAALTSEASNVATAGPGMRNNALNTAAFNLGQMVASGWGARSEVEYALASAAATAGLASMETRKTIASGINSGMTSPRPRLADRQEYLPSTTVEIRLERTPAGDIVDADTGEVVEEAEEEVTTIDESLTHVPGVLGEVVDWIISSSRHPNRRLALAGAIGICGTLLGRRICGPTELGTHLYTVVTYPTGGGKQHIINAVKRAFVALNLPRHIGPPDFSSYQALIDHITQEPLSLSAMDEFGMFLNRVAGSRSSHENNIPAHLMQLWGLHYDAPYTTQRTRQAQSQAIHAPALSILGFSTPSQFFSALKSKDVSNGFLNRFLVIDGGARVEEVTPQASLRDMPDSLKRGLIALYACGHRRGHGDLETSIPDKNSPLLGDFHPAKVPWGNDGAEEFRKTIVREIFHELDTREDGDLLGRTADIALRLATIRACSDMPQHPVVMLEHMQWGAAVAMQSAKKLLADVQSHMEDQLSAAALEKRFFRLLNAAGGQITMRDLRRSMSRYQRNIWDIDALIKTLENAGMVMRSNRDGSGRSGLVIQDTRLFRRIAV
jgi:hypothetical protein